MGRSKYINIGDIIDGIWKIDSITRRNKDRQAYYLVKNIYNGKEYEVGYTQIRRIVMHKSSMSNIITKREFGFSNRCGKRFKKDTIRRLNHGN